MRSTLASLALASSPLLVEQRGPVGLGLAAGALEVGGGQDRVGALLHDPLGVVRPAAETISSSGMTATFWPLMNRWPFFRPAAIPRSASRGLARPVDDAAHDRHLQRDLPLAERGHRLVGDGDHVDLGAPAARAGDEVDVLALAQTEALEQLAPGPRLLDRVGGERVADGVADALGERACRSRRCP